MPALGEVTSELGGYRAIEVPDGSTGADHTTPAGIAGTAGGVCSVDAAGKGTCCTGVLVTSKTFVTAAHCVFDDNCNPGSAFKVSFPKAPLHNGAVFSSTAQPGVCHNPRSTNGQDVAVLRLDTAVPSTVIAKPAEIYLGNVEDLINAGAPQVVVVGRGLQGYVEGTFPPVEVTDGKLRYGALYAYVTTGEIRNKRGQGVNHYKGDSGGPVFAWEPVRGRYVLAGIHSGWRTWYDTWWDEVTGDERHAKIHAPINMSRGVAIDIDREIPELDPDKDGIQEAFDPCPASRCAARRISMTHCSDPGQFEDKDGDGVGDSCDNCPPSFNHANLSWPWSSTNPDQLDTDGDGIGDRCDLCPTHPDPYVFSNPGFLPVQPDFDRDMIGDACDLCREDPDAGFLGPRQCFVTSSVCAGEKRGTCVPIDRDGVEGRCSDAPDHDGDGVPDACDSCEGWDDWGTNSNEYVEKAQFVVPMDDACDPVPVLDVRSQREVRASTPTSPTMGLESRSPCR